MALIRRAREEDAQQICDVFKASYGEAYTYPIYYDATHIKKMIFSDDTAVFVAEDTETGRIVGTASVIVEIGAHADLVSEFGRLTVTPEARGHGIGSRLMEARLELLEDRNQVCLSETRVTHSHSTQIGIKYGFAPLGFMPLKLQLAWRESAALMVRHLGNAVSLRRNNPRVIPEVYPMASLCMRNAGLSADLIVDESEPAYPWNNEFEVGELNQDGYAQLLRFERGRFKYREIFGPARLHYGFFKLRARHATYLVARRHGAIVGAIGFTRDDFEAQVRIFELIPLDDEVIRFLLAELIRRCDEWGIKYVETDVSGYAPRMQRTLIELGFIPAAYVPALTFHHVERLDLVKFVRVTAPLEWGPLELSDPIREIADMVINALELQRVIPRVAGAMENLGLFRGLSDVQARRLAARCHMEHFDKGQHLFEEGTPSTEMYLILDGRVELHMNGAPLPYVSVEAGEVLGEVSMLGQQPHSATAVASTALEVAVLPHDGLTPLIRRHPGLGLTLYRNLANEVAGKLYRSDKALLEHVTAELYK